jgi:hypothetical protein
MQKSFKNTDTHMEMQLLLILSLLSNEKSNSPAVKPTKLDAKPIRESNLHRDS